MIAGRLVYTTLPARKPDRIGVTLRLFKHKSGDFCAGSARGGALGYLLGGYVPPGTPNWHPVLEKNFPKIDTPF